MVSDLCKFMLLSNWQRFLLLEAFLYLVLVKTSIIILPFRSVLKLIHHNDNKDQFYGIQRDNQRIQVCWAINCISAKFSSHFVCIHRGIAVFYMLRRRNIKVTIHYGVKRLQDNSFSAHVWAMDGNQGIMGHEISSSYKILFTVPAIEIVS